MAVTFCPRCGTARIGSFRYCRSCRLDFDELPPESAMGSQPGWSPSPAAPKQPADGSLPPAPQPGWGAAPAQPPQPGWGPAAPLVATPAALPTEVASYRTISLVAWVGSALCMGWLALIQFGFANTIFDNGSFAALAAWNLLTAVLVIYGAARLSRSTKRDSFRQSAVWAIVIVVLQGFQIVQGATHIAYILSTVAAAGGGLFAFLVYQGMPKDAGRPAGP